MGAALSLAGVVLQAHMQRQDRREMTSAERVARLAAALGPIRTLILDLDPMRFTLNVGEHSRAELGLLDARWRPLRDQLSTFAVAGPDPVVAELVTKVDVAIDRVLNRLGWIAGGWARGDALGDGSLLEDAKAMHAEAKDHVVSLLNAVHGSGAAAGSTPPGA
jgi:hypothetical protein